MNPRVREWLWHAKLRVLTAVLAWVPRFYSRWIRGIRDSDVRTRERMGSAGTHADAACAPIVLVIDGDFPDASRDAGGRAIYGLVVLLRQLGARVLFWSTARHPSTRGREALIALDVVCAARDAKRELPAWLDATAGSKRIDTAVVSRPTNAAVYASLMKGWGGTRRVFYGHDIHYQRMQAARRIGTGSWNRFDVACMRRIEQRLWRELDVALYPAEEEVRVANAYLRSRGMAATAERLPLWSVGTTASGVAAGPEGRSGMLFVGSFRHRPNVDGLDWFFSEVLPEVRAVGCDDTVYVVGSGMGGYTPPAPDPAVKVVGWLDDDALDALYAKVRLALAPLRYGGGVKGKVLEAMAHGVPCVGTTAAVQGLPTTELQLDVCDGAVEFAGRIVRLLHDDGLWHSRANANLARLPELYGREAVARLVARVVLGSAGCDAITVTSR